MSEYNSTMAVIHISEADAVRDFASLVSRVRAGEEVHITTDSDVIALSRLLPDEAPRKTLSEAIRRAKERNLDVLLDDQFGRDLEQVICNHEHEGIRDPWAE